MLEQKESCPGSMETTLPVSGPETEIVVSSAEAESQVIEERQEHLSADLVAWIQEAYHFNGLNNSFKLFLIFANFYLFSVPIA